MVSHAYHVYIAVSHMPLSKVLLLNLCIRFNFKAMSSANYGWLVRYFVTSVLPYHHMQFQHGFVMLVIFQRRLLVK